MEFDDIEPNPIAHAAIMEVLDNQLRSGEPPETRATYDRLLGEGIDREEARRLVAVVIAVEIYGVIKSMQPFNHERFVERLELLPEMPWMDE